MDGLVDPRSRAKSSEKTNAEPESASNDKTATTYRVTDDAIISSITPESAHRNPDGTWHLTWLPDRRLSFDQALAGMQLDELLSDLQRAKDRNSIDEAERLATQLGIVLAEAIVKLAKRVDTRNETDIVRKRRMDGLNVLLDVRGELT